MNRQKIALLIYADDLVLIGRSSDGLQMYQSQSLLDCYTLKHPSTSAVHTFEMFDTLFKTKLLCGYKIWGTGYYKVIELYHAQFIKRTLGVISSTNTSMIFAETGRFPLAININLRIIKYWVKILSSEESSFIKLVYSEMFQNLLTHEWIQYVKNLLCSSGFSGIWEQQFGQDERKFIKQFEQRSKDIYIQNGFNAIRESSRAECTRRLSKCTNQRDINHKH